MEEYDEWNNLSLLQNLRSLVFTEVDLDDKYVIDFVQNTILPKA